MSEATKTCRVRVDATVSNGEDTWPHAEVATVRSVRFGECIFSDEAIARGLPASIVRTLGLGYQRAVQVRIDANLVVAGVHTGAVLSLEGRECQVQCLALPDDLRPVPVLGREPLAMLGIQPDFERGSYELLDVWFRI